MNVNKFYTLSETYVPENLRNIELSYAYGEEGENKLIDYAIKAIGGRFYVYFIDFIFFVSIMVLYK